MTAILAALGQVKEVLIDWHKRQMKGTLTISFHFKDGGIGKCEVTETYTL